MLLGLDAPDDAGIYRINDELALVQTVDFFTPIVDDPSDWGAIAAANAFSDVYAMGGRPATALNLVGWPADLDVELLASVLEGAAQMASQAGVTVIGGHTVDDPEPKFGMAVTGFIHPDGVIDIRGARGEMLIYLTKPLGTGAIATAIKRGEAPEDLAAQAIESMKVLNREASLAMIVAGASAATDVTGFGLLGHLHGLAKASGVSAEIWSNEVPRIDGVTELIAKGLVPGGTRRNEDHFGQWVRFASDIDEVKRTLLFDAQTSGGLLICILPELAEGLEKELTERGVPSNRIGRFVDADAGMIEVKNKR